MANNYAYQNLTIFVIILVFVKLTNSFNVGTKNYVIHRGEKLSMFGFSVAQYKDRAQNWLLVGAPQASTSQPGVQKGGSVYRCEVSIDDTCHVIPFDRTGNNLVRNGASQVSQMDNKSAQWFGMTVKSSQYNGTVMACAPRYVHYTSNFERREPVGTCYVATNSFSTFEEYSPCRIQTEWGYHKQGSCQVGIGADVSKDGKRLYLGAPGSWYWQGQVFSLNITKREQVRPPSGSALLKAAGRVFSQSAYNRPDSWATKEGSLQDDDSYLGYAVVSADFTGEGVDGAAVSMPKGASLYGKVMIYTWDLVNVYNVTGGQLGAYFGYSLAAADMDGDGRQDLIVGAPLYTDLTNNEGKYETGRIYVFYQEGKYEGGRLVVFDQDKKERFRHMDTRDGEKSKCRFGLSLTTLGDINKDGYEDVAVGAPYDGVHERGAVYIYHGSEHGISEKFSQVVYAEDVGPTISTFGFSISGGRDLDENEYPDLLVGAYESDTIIFFRSRPVVVMNPKLNFSGTKKQISLDDKSCKLRSGTPVPCSSLNVCLEYSGIGVERKLDFEVQIILDSKKTKSPRMFFMATEGRNTMNETYHLHKGALKCNNVNVYIKPGIRDKLTPIEAELRYTMLPSPTSSSTTLRRSQRSLEPILNQNLPPVQKDTINIQKNCGPDDVCIPDLNMNAEPSVTKYLLGSEKRLEFNVQIYNSGEDAFESMFYLTVPPGLNYIKIERLDRDAEVVVQCSAPSSATNNTLLCDIGNPLPARSLVSFKVFLQPDLSENSDQSRYDFYMEVNTTNPEIDATIADNQKKFSIPIWVETDLIVEGVSQPTQLYYNTSVYKSANFSHENQMGPQVLHKYSIRNKGPSSIVEAEAYFVWPSQTIAGEHLLYLLEQPETSGRIKCETFKHVNDLNVKVHRNRSHLDSFTEDEKRVSQSGGQVVIERNEQSTRTGSTHRQQQSSVEKHRTSSSSATSSSSTRTQYSTSSWSSSWSSENGGDGSYRRGDWERTRRQVDEDYDDSESQLEAALGCGPTFCTKTKCILGPLAKDEIIQVVFRGRVMVHTLKKIGDREVKLSSQVATRMTRLPYVGELKKTEVKTMEVVTETFATDTYQYKPDYVPWWVVVLSACAGAAILILLIFLLWKCGFFTRNRPSGTHSVEKEPLNRNGHYQAGDEAL